MFEFSRLYREVPVNDIILFGELQRPEKITDEDVMNDERLEAMAKRAEYEIMKQYREQHGN